MLPPPMFVIVAILAAGLAWGAYFYLKDKYEPEPGPMLLAVFLSGALSAIPALLAYWLAERAGIDTELFLSPDRFTRLIYCVCFVGVIEEWSKFLSVQVLIGRHREFDEPLDGLIYAAFGALGFATAENLLVSPYLSGPQLWGRIAASPLTHALFAAVWGYSLSLDRFAHPRRPLRVAAGLLLAAVLHGLYDYLVLSSAFERILGALLVLVLRIAFLVAVPKLLARSPHRPRSTPCE